MNKIAIIISSDYEVFGDGTGAVSDIQIKTTTEILQKLEMYGAKLTIMFEYGQYLAYKKFANGENNFNFDNKLIESQLINAIKKGHDVQLHYHAQWNNATYNIDTNSFNVDLNHVDITSLEYTEIVNILKQGKAFLEKLLKPYNSDYECIGFRAGSWAVGNEKKLFKALKETGFLIDSSVVPNTKFESEQVNFEYVNSPHQYLYWNTNMDLSTRSFENSFIEMPIYTKKNRLSFLKYFNQKFLNNKKIVKKLYKSKISENNYSIFQKLSKVFNRNYYMADLNTMNAKTLLSMVEDAYTENKFNKSLAVLPLMFISHSKTSFDLNDLNFFFEQLEKRYKDEIVFWSMQEATEYILNLKQEDEFTFINLVKKLDIKIDNSLAILGQEKYLKSKSDDYGWFLSNNFILAYYIDKKAIFKRLVFSTNVINLNGNLTPEKEKIFLDATLDYIKKNKICDFVYKAQSNVVFTTCPKNSKCVGWGTYQVDLQKSEDLLFQSFSTKSRNVIRKAMKEGVLVKEEKNVEVIYVNIKETLKRQKSIHYPSLEYITKISKLKDSAKCLVAVKDNIVQGSLVLLYDSKCGYALYAGSIKSPQTGSMDLLHFEAMKFCQSNNILKYDFVGTRLNIKSGSKQEGINRFKRKFNPSLIKGYAFSSVINPYKYFIYKKLVKLYFLAKGYAYNDPIENILKEEGNEKVLLIGPRFNKKNSELVGGPIVLFEGLIKEFKNSNIDFDIIDTNKKNYRFLYTSYICIISNILYKSLFCNSISFHSSRDYMLFGPFIILIGKLFGRKTSLRKFGGEAKRTYEDAIGLKKKYLLFIFQNFNSLFMETKYLENFFKRINKDTHWFPNVRTRNEIAKLPRKFQKRFVFISHVIKEKGITEIIEASAKLDNSYTVDVYGPILDSDYSVKSFVGTNVSYKGALKSSEVLEVLNSYDVALLPSYKEGYPGIIIESYSLGIPVISTNLDSIMEIVDNYKTGILVEPRSVLQLEEAIKYFDLNNYEKMSELAYEKFSLFESTLNTKKFISIIRNV